MRSKRPILLIEDDKIDAMTVKRAFRDLNILNPIVECINGEEALIALRKKNHLEIPCLILLDLNMPKMNGIEFLDHVKSDPVLKLIPVVVLTTSNEDRDKRESFRRCAAGYMVKPVEYEKFIDTISEINTYWTASENPVAS